MSIEGFSAPASASPQRTRESRSMLRSVRKRRHQVRFCMAAVEIANAQAIGTPHWGENLSQALRDLQNVFAGHTADGQAPNSALQQICVRRPDLAGDVQRLQQDQARLLDRLRLVVRRAEIEADEELRFDVGSLLLAMSRYRQASADLFYNCYCVDLGAIDDS